MRDTKHTPGPWFSECEWVFYDDDANLPAGFKVVDQQGKVGTEESISNARLIAASPQLLESLDWFIKVTKATWPTSIRNSPEYRAAEAVRALATGDMI